MFKRVSKNQIKNLTPVAEGFKVVMPSSTKKWLRIFSRRNQVYFRDFGIRYKSGSGYFLT